MIEYTVKVYKNDLDHEDAVMWYLPNGKLGRKCGPAIEYADGRKYWYRDGLQHREDGPAVERPNGYNEWWLNGKRLSEHEFAKMLRKDHLPHHCKMIVEFNGKKYKLTEIVK